MGEYGYAVNALFSKKVIRDALVNKIKGTVIAECKDLCSVKNPSLLRKSSPVGLKEFTESAHVAELSDRAPVLYSLLSAAAGKATDGKAGDQNVEKATGENGDKTAPAVSIAASVLLKTRCPQMSAQAYRVSAVLWHSGAKKQVSPSD